MIMTLAWRCEFHKWSGGGLVVVVVGGAAANMCATLVSLAVASLFLPARLSASFFFFF